MKSILKRFLSRVLSDKAPVIRKGGSRAERLITILQPGEALRVIPAAQIGVLTVDQRGRGFAIVCDADVVCEFESRDDAVAALMRIHRLVSPSPWRWVWRFLILMLAYMLFVPSAAPQRGYAPPVAAAGIPPRMGLATAPSPSIAPPAPGPEAGRAQPPNDEPFGLPVGGESRR